MDIHGYPMYMDIHRYPWISMDIHGCPWIFMDVHGYPWISMDTHGYPWIPMDIHGYQWISIHGYPVMSMNTNGCPWISIYIYGHPWIIQGLFMDNPLISMGYPIQNPFRHQMARHSSWEDFNQTHFDDVQMRGFATFVFYSYFVMCPCNYIFRNIIWKER